MVAVKRILIFVTLLTFLGGAFFFYRAGYRYPTCCDAAITLAKAGNLAQGEIQGIQPFNPSTRTPLYESYISAEYPLHSILAVVYMVFPQAQGNLHFARDFFIILFLIPALSLFLFARTWLRSPFLALLVVIFTYLTFWFGGMYWTGHVAQMLGMFFLFLGLYFLHNYTKLSSVRDAVAVLGVCVALFFVHVLSFLIFFITAVTAIGFHVIKIRERRVSFLISFCVCAIAIFSFFLFTPKTGNLLPNFSVTDISAPLQGIVNDTLRGDTIIVLAFLGFVYAIVNVQVVLLSFLTMAALLSQSAVFGVPFFPYRFNIFLAVALVQLLVVGFAYALSVVRVHWQRSLLSLIVLLAIVPFSVAQQNEYKKCYIANCAGLNPTQVPDGDILAMQWLRKFTPTSAVIFSNQKFGYYIPIVSNRFVEFPVDGKVRLFTAGQASQRASVAKEFGITYVFLGSVAAGGSDASPGTAKINEAPFQDLRYFSLVYDASGTKIYRVL